jgi:hypothetical protein
MTARDIAKAWRANPADRLRIEREIAVSGRQGEFRRDEAGNLIALRTDDDRQRSLGASASIRAFKSSSAGMREMPCIGFERESHTGLIYIRDEAA